LDKVSLHGIQFYGYHGVLPEEGELGTRFAVDVDLFLDLKRAGETDGLAHTVDYTEVYELVLEIGTKMKFKLIESVAERIASEILRRFKVKEVTVRVKKLFPPIPGVLDYVSVEIHRNSSPTRRKP
jgi:dihydroneopterin aldolase